MAGIRQTQKRADESLGEDDRRAAGVSFEQSLRSLTRRLNHSTVGVALYDKKLHCKALNAAIAKVNGAPVSAHIGKTIHQSFGKEARNLEPAFRRVWTTSNSLLNFPWTAQLPARKETGRWLVNFYPIADELGTVRVVAATFSEITKRSSVELQPRRLPVRFRAGAPGEAILFGEKFAELPARTLELVQRSVELLKSSLLAQRYISETRIERALVRLALCWAGTRDQKPVSCPTLRTLEPCAAPPAHQGPSKESELPASCPSLRERQVLYLLAEGKSNKEIGSVLDISTRTVESYRARMMLKLDLHSTAALERYAIRNHIVEA